MIKIDALSLNLPADYQTRAESIAGHIGEALAGRDVSASLRVNHLDSIDVNITRGQSDRAIGAHIAGAIHSRMSAADGGKRG